MPYGEQHKRKRTKNIALLIILVALFGAFFALTMIRLGGAG